MFGAMEFLGIITILVYGAIAIFVLTLFLRIVKAIEKVADTYVKKNS